MTQCAKIIVGFMANVATFLSNVFSTFFLNYYLNVYCIYVLCLFVQQIHNKCNILNAKYTAHSRPLFFLT